MTEFVKDQLKAFVERIERLTEEKKSIADDIRDVYAEAKGAGFDVKALREIVKRRTWEAEEMREHDALVETYMHALGMLADTPLGRSATEREFGETKMSMQVPGMEPVHFTAADLKLATAKLKTRAGRRAVQAAADRAEARS